MKAGRHLTSDDISAFLDGELELDGAGKAHLASCPRCSGALEERRKLRRLARAAKPEVPTDRMWQAIREGIRREPAPRPFFLSFIFRAPRWVLGSAGTVAAALFALVVVRQVSEVPLKQVPSMVEPAPAERGKSGGSPASAVRREMERPKDSAENRAVAPAEAGRAEPGAGAGESAAFDEAVERSAPTAPSAAGRAPSALAAPGGVPTTPAAPAAAPALQAAEGEKAPARSAKKAVARATEAASRADQARPSFEGARFILSADSLDTSAGGVVRAAGRVSVRPARPGLSYIALIDGLSRTLTGTQEAVSAEIYKQGERLIIRTKE